MNPAVDADEEDETEAERLQQIQEAVDAGERAGKLPSTFKKEFAELQKPKVDWRDLVGRWMEGRSTSDWSLSRPKQTGSIMMPRLDSETFGKIALAIDSSGSVDKEQMAQAITELFGALEVYEDEGMEQTITTMFTDTVVHGCFELSDPSDLDPPEGGGGTDFKEAFKAIDALEDQPLGAVVITDGWVDISKEEEPSCDVVWIVTEGYSSQAFTPPFGEVIFMNAL
jgi:predicted metal-dependent peptidase